MNIKTSGTVLVHSEGTKFYGAYRIASDCGSKTITVTHYGALPKSFSGTKSSRTTSEPSVMSGVPFPSDRGRVDIHMGDALREKSAAKMRRGYSLVANFENVGSLDAGWFCQFFGAEHGARIRREFAEFLEGSTAESKSITPSVKADNIKQGKISSPEERPASWGTW